MLRILLRHPAYLFVSVATLTLAVGANLVVFSFVNALWLRPPMIADPDRVVVLARDFSIPDPSRFSELGLESIRQSPALTGVAGQVVTSGMFNALSPRIVIPALGHTVESLWVTPEYFSVLGVGVRGREFRSGDGEAAGLAPAVISDHLWRTALRSRADAIGLRLVAHPVDLEIVGIAPAGFQGARRGERADLWLPHRLLPRLTGSDLSNLRFATMPMVAFARLKPGVTIEAAKALMAQQQRTPELTSLSTLFGAADLPMVLVGGSEVMTMAGVTAAFVLVGGCATLMAIVLIHYERRGRELAVRVALGATRSRLVSQLTLELFAVASTGMLAALCVSAWVIDLLPQFRLPGGVDLSRLDLTIDSRVVLVAFLCCIAALGAASVVPIRRFTRATMGLGLVSPASTSARSSLAFRKAVLGIHVGATTLVMVAAGLFVQSVTRALGTGPGFDAVHTIFATVETHYRFVTEDEAIQKARIARDIGAATTLIDGIRALPGVEVVGLGAPPLGRDLERSLDRPRTIAVDGVERDIAIAALYVGDDYLDALGVTLSAGHRAAAHEAVITPALAHELWGEESPLGKRLRDGPLAMPVTVVGVADIAMGSIRLGRQPGMFSFGDVTVPVAVGGSVPLSLAIRAKDVSSLRAPLERLLLGAFPDAPYVSVIAGPDLIATDLGRERMSAWIFSRFGLVALLLAIVSVFGLVAYLIESRWREFAVRMVLGASRGDVARRALWAGLEPVVIGAAAGLVVALGVARTIESYLFGITGADPATYAGAFVLVIGCALLAGVVACRQVFGLSLTHGLRRE